MRIGKKKPLRGACCIWRTKASETLALERAARRNHQPGAAGRGSDGNLPRSFGGGEMTARAVSNYEDAAIHHTRRVQNWQ